MKSLKNRLLVLFGLIAFIVSGSRYFNPAVQAENKLNQYADRYQAFSSVTADGLYKIDIAQISDDGSLLDEMVAYCLQYTYGFPGAIDNELRPAIYDKEELTNADITDFDSKKDKLNAILYYGYPTDGNHYVEDKIISATRLRALTQFAIWYVIDNKKAADFNLSGTELEIFNKLISPDLKAPTDFAPVFFKNDRSIQANPSAHGNKQYYQHLVASKRASVSYKVFAQKLWETAPNAATETSVTFKLVNKDGSQIEGLTEEQATKTLTTKAKEKSSDVVSWDNLPKNAQSYKIVEVTKLDGFTSSPVTGSGHETSPYTITNSKTDIQAVPTITVTKRWDGAAVDTDNIYFGIYRVDADGNQTLVTKNDVSDYVKPKFENPLKLESNKSQIVWNQIYLSLLKDTNNPSGERFRYIVKELCKERADFVEWKKPGYETTYETVYNEQGSMSTVATNKQTKRFPYQFGKVGADALANQLKGAELRIVTVSSQDGKEVTSTVDSWTTDGSLHEVTLEAGNYRLIEDQAPAGYNMATVSDFTVSEQGVLEFTSNKQNVQVTDNTVQLINKKEVIASVTIKKQTTQGQPLPDATLVLTNAATKTDIASFKTTDKERTFTLKPGKYTVAEEKAPANYVAIQPFEFTVNEQGEVVGLKKTNETDTITIDGKVITIVDKDAKKLTLKAQKTWVNKPENTPDVYFQLTRKVGESDAEVVETKKLENDQTSVAFTNLDTHNKDGVLYTYQISEVDKDGNTWQYDNYTSEAVKTVDTTKAYGDGNDTWVWKNTYTVKSFPIEISKQNIAGDILENATITVRDKKTSEVISDAKGVKLENYVTTKDNLKIKLVAGEYTFEENAAPVGYDVVTTFTFIVDENGKVTTTSKDAKTNGAVLTVIDQATKVEPKKHNIEISKQNIAGDILENATITVRDKKTSEVISDAKGVKLENYVTTKDNLKIKLVAGEYTFEENAAPVGYDVVTTFTFIVDENGKVTTTSKDAKTNGAVLTVIDQATKVEPKKHDIEISKVGLGGKELVGAVIEIRDENGKMITDARTNEPLRYTSTDTAKMVSLTAGTYIFHEETAPEGYQVVTDITFTVDENGNIKVIKNTTTGNAEVTDGKLVVTDDVTNHPVVFSKVASLGGEELPGAQIIIFQEDGRTEVTRFTSTMKPKELTLPMGTYIFHEETAPEGYNVVTDITFAVDPKGAVTVTNINGNTVEANGNKLQVVDTAKAVEPKTHDIHFSKQNLGGEEIVGAQIEIHNAAAEVVNKWTSTGTVQTMSLLPGVYTFHEMAAPTGYVKVTAITFAVSQEGQVSILNGDGNKVSSAQNTMIVIDEAVAQPLEVPKGSLLVQKVDETTNAVLEGAVFSVTGMITETTSTVDSNAIDAELNLLNEEIAKLQAQLETLQKAEQVDETLVNQSQAKLGLFNNKVTELLVQKAGLKPVATSTVVAKDFGTVITAANGQASLSELPDGEYTITEVQAPAGYDLDATPRKVVIKDGQADVANNTVIITNTKTVVPDVAFDISISKVDLGGAELAGAQIQLKQGDTIVHEWTSTDTTHIVNLKAGRYTFHEVAAPTGYKVVTDIEFAVDEKGQISIISSKADEAKIVNNTLVVTDHKEPKDEPKDNPKDDPKDSPRDNSKDKPKENPKDESKKAPQDLTSSQSTPTKKKGLPKTNSTDSMIPIVLGVSLLVNTIVLFWKSKKSV
ncbi:SpaA isopeptide-forming pilin-related protein [Streptococcus merionis]|uniref:SpaA isopeptide-forming pilin-related protein n=1 Tax=Streptococcus merionis TaxID=400065 RepID=UPI0026F32A5C|nr:SpaA isopeptide-forming pilin-related protein [Streptococcus merionis]